MEVLKEKEKEYLDYLFEQHKKGQLGNVGINKLIQHGYIKSKREETVVENTETQDDLIKRYCKAYKKDIEKEEWMPESLTKHSDDFFNWINSITYGYFPNKIHYEKFELYKAQAYKWIADNISPSNYDDDDLKQEAILEEYRRCDQNTLYFANRYGIVKEGNNSGGAIRYVAKEHNAFLFYLMDCGYSMFVGKPRQIFSTTQVGLFAVKKMIFQANYFMKFITEDDNTGLEIFQDKIKYPFSELPEWMKPEAISVREDLFHLGKQSKKGKIEFPNTRMKVEAPHKTAINGGSPQCVFIDEIGNIPILTEMMTEARPTMFMDSKQDGNLVLKRQCIGWGCVCAGTKVWNNNGDLVNIEDLKIEDGIIGYNGGFAEPNKITNSNPISKKNCVKITTNTGRFLECSEDHPILYKAPHKRVGDIEFREAKDMLVGDFLCTIGGIDIFGVKEMKEPRFIGWLIGDGSYGVGIGRQPRFYNCDEEICSYIEKNFDVTIFNGHKTKDGKDYKEYAIRGWNPYLREIGIHGQSKQFKRLPINMHSYRKEDILELIGGLFDTDGCVLIGKKKSIQIESISYMLLDDLRMLMQKIGIHCNISKIKARIAPNRKDRNDYYRLSVDKSLDILLFHKYIKFKIKYKQDRLEDIAIRCKIHTSISDTNLENIRFERVISVEKIGEKDIYNLTAGTNNTYIANGIITHNTGVSDKKGKGAFKNEWFSILNLWEERNESCGFVPVFLSWHCRCDSKHYKTEKEVYFSGKNNQKGVSLEDRKIMFHQHYPSTFNDMFTSTSSKLVSSEIITEALNRIRSKSNEIRPIYGYFEPVYDYNSKEGENSDVPYKIVDANFIAVDDDNIESATAIRICPPDRDYKDRYYQGTDPISVETGKSLMSSTIHDDHLKMPVCMVNFRKQHDHKYAFLQCLLMGLYYDTNYATGNKRGCPELVEANIGTNYTDYKESKGFAKNLVYNSELPEHGRGGSRVFGIDNKGVRTGWIISKLREYINSYGNNIWIETYFRQLDTFVESQKNKTESWGSVNKDLYPDDALFGLVYSYICRLSFPYKSAINGSNDRRIKQTVYFPLTRMPDGSLSRSPQLVSR